MSQVGESQQITSVKRQANNIIKQGANSTVSKNMKLCSKNITPKRDQYVSKTLQVSNKAGIDHVRDPIIEKNCCVNGEPKRNNCRRCDFDNINHSLHKNIVKRCHFSDNRNSGPLIT